MKFIIGLFVGAVVILVLWNMFNSQLESMDNQEVNNQGVTENLASENQLTQEEVITGSVVTDGSYVVDIERSTFNWKGQKPLVAGYVHSGSIGLSSGEINVAEDVATGSFLIDMNTLSVSDTPAKPGSESLLESHLKSERWFNVEANPTAEFVITEVKKLPNSDENFVYDVTGTLTMNGESGELTFPATIYKNEADELVATADFEFDRTKWGITAGSGSFFDNLEDNVIDDMIGLSFMLVAEMGA